MALALGQARGGPHGDPALEERASPERSQTHETSAVGGARLPRPVRDLILALGLAAAVGISCPWGQRLPSSGLDQGWMLGLAWAHDTHGHFGSDLLFTYGPWGWLTAPVLLHAGSLIAAGLFSLGAVLALWWAVTTSLMTVGRGVLGSCFAVVVGAIATPLVFAATGPSWTLAVALFCLGLRSVAAERRPTTRLLVAVSLCAALLLQVKFSEGVLVSCLWLLLVARSASRQSLMVAAATFFGAFIAFWISAGQALGDLGSWLTGSWLLTMGYPDAMQLGGMSPRVMTAAFLTGALLLLTLVDGRHRTRSVIWGALLTTGLLVFAGKQAFTRQDDLHSVAFFSAVVAVGVQASCRPVLQLCRRLILGVSLLSIVVSGVTSDPRLQRLGWRETSSLLTHATPLGTRLDQAREEMRLDYAVSGHVLSRIGDRPVAVDPYEVGAAWAYDLNWSPVPVLQPYSAYEPGLDAKNAAHLLATPGMAVLREESVIDDRLQLWDSPRYNMALLCSFREVDHDARWTLFVRDAHRCGPAERRPSVVVSARMPVRVPAADPGTIVTMSFAPDGESLGRRLVSALTHSSPLTVTLGHDNYRLPRALTGGPLIARLPAEVRWPTRSRGRPDAATVTFNVRGTVTFSTVRLDDPD